jgi:hypothetical protein
MVIEELQQSVGLLLLQADDIARELRVDVQRLLSCGRVSSDNWVLVNNRLSSLDPTYTNVSPNRTINAAAGKRGGLTSRGLLPRSPVRFRYASPSARADAPGTAD